jgi:hypothetical protein
LTADGLLCVSELLNLDQLKYLNLSQNFKIDQINSLHFFKSSPKVDSISLNKIKFTKNNADMNQLKRILKQNRR